MRIAYVCADPGVPVFGRKGCSVHLQEVIRALIKKGACVDLFSNSVEGNPPMGLETIRVHQLPHLSKGNTSEREHAAIAANPDLADALEKEGPFDCIYERYSLWSFAGMEFAKARSIPGLLEVNAPLLEEQEKYRKLFNRTKAEEVAGQVFRAASTMLAVSNEVADYIKGWEIPENKVQVVPNGIDPRRFPENLKPSFTKSKSTFNLGFVGSLKPWHGVSHLIDAFALFHQDRSDTRLILIGDGPQRDHLEDLVSRHSLEESVHFTGSVAPDEVPGWLASLDVAVAPYPPMEDFYFSPLKVFEYMATGLPIVASEIGQLKDLIQHEVNGLLCPPGDRTALVDAITRLYKKPGLRNRLGQSARATVMNQYTWDRVAEAILQVSSKQTTSYS